MGGGFGVRGKRVRSGGAPGGARLGARSAVMQDNQMQTDRRDRVFTRTALAFCVFRLEIMAHFFEWRAPQKLRLIGAGLEGAWRGRCCWRDDLFQNSVGFQSSISALRIFHRPRPTVVG